jgi:hypothetical protein
VPGTDGKPALAQRRRVVLRIALSQFTDGRDVVGPAGRGRRHAQRRTFLIYRRISEPGIVVLLNGSCHAKDPIIRTIERPSVHSRASASHMQESSCGSREYRPSTVIPPAENPPQGPQTPSQVTTTGCCNASNVRIRGGL